ncbi:MAG: hypothetical protein HQ508_01515 [Candidatus Marinimicrobia bacterium]|nr:hypothetical protein [Candidatus Neomarinimicrobiota bacterium]
MKFRLYVAIVAITLGFWSCDEPIAYENSTFIYNPFSLQKDTLNSIDSIGYGAAEISWGSHFRAWVGDTRYYKSGISIDFLFADTSLDISSVDSVQLQLRHQQSFSENGIDTLSEDYETFGFYETTGLVVDIASSSYGMYLGSDTGKVTSKDNYWNYTLPADIIVTGDSAISLGLFPDNSGVMSAIYGGGSVSRPNLRFFFHEPDTAGNDSATSIAYTADSLYMHMMEQPGIFDRTQYYYLSQLSRDSLVFNVNLDAIITHGDTIHHVISSSILPMIDLAASSLYKPDTVQNFKIRVTEPLSNRNVDIELNGDISYKINEIKGLIQAALDDDLDRIELILRPNHVGYDPGFIAISKDASKSALFVSSSFAVQP